MMIAVNKLGRLDKIILSRVGRVLRRHRQQVTPVPGLPEGLSFETVNMVCQEQMGAPLHTPSYTHLSGWKQSGAYRLFLEVENGRSWQIIFKNAIYEPDDTPALEGLPVIPGLPEYLVYGQSNKLSQYLPQVYLCREIIPEYQYHYLLEDLALAYEPLSLNQARQLRKRKKWVLKAVAELPNIHQALHGWSERVDQDYLLRYDRAYSTALLAYAHENLNRYVRETSDTAVSTFLNQWSQIAAIYEQDDLHDPRLLRPIHGDYHVTNVYIQRKRPRHLKLIDWEWAGFGKAHTDLAALLNRARPDLEREALAIYAAQEKGLSPHQHHRQYESSQLERGLLDTAFLARQQLEAKRKVAWIPSFIQKSVERVQLAYARLKEDTPLVG